MSRPLPFDDFLDALRGRGFAVGLHEHLALGRLLATWDGVDRETLGAAIAALVARSDDEVVEARRLFRELYTPPPPPLPTGGDATEPAPAPVWWRPAAIVGVIGLVIVLGATAGYYFRPPAPTPPPGSGTAPPPAATEPGGVVPTLPPTVPDLPDPPARIAAGAVWQTAGALFLMALAAFWGLERRRAHRAWLSDSWRRALGALPGPYRVDIRVRALQTRIPRADIEDAANILGRIYRTDERTRELDPPESLRETLRRGLLPTLVFRRVRTARPIVVLQDVGLDMGLWRAKVERLLLDLRRQGVALERWYFDGDPRRLSERPFGPPHALADVLDRRPDSPVLVVSTGGGLPAVGPQDEWLQTMRRRPRLAWLTPVADVRLWPDALASGAVSAWPMSRDGLTAASRSLAGQDTADWIRTRILDEGHVLADDVERLKRLASLVPHPTPELLDALRQRFAPDIPDSAIAHIAHAAGTGGRHEIRLPDAEVARLSAAMRAESPNLEAAVRDEIVRHLSDSEPPEGSAAHLRWRLARALQRERLAELGHGDAAESRAEIDRLRAGPLWEEAHRAQRPSRDSRGGDALPVPPSTLPRIWTPRPRVSPGWRQMVAATVATFAIVFLAWQGGAFPVAAFARFDGAYEISRSAADAATLEIRAARAGEPNVITLYRDSAVFRTVTLTPGNPTQVTLNRSTEMGATFQAQAVRLDGNVAQSNALWIPNGDEVVVLIDARPWARVTITTLVVPPSPSQRSTAEAAPVPGVQVVTSEATPLRVALSPGRYRLALQNGGVTPPSSQDVVVAPNDPAQRFIVIMPGFDPATAVQ